MYIFFQDNIKYLDSFVFALKTFKNALLLMKKRLVWIEERLLHRT